MTVLRLSSSKAGFSVRGQWTSLCFFAAKTFYISQSKGTDSPLLEKSECRQDDVEQLSCSIDGWSTG